MHRTRWGSSSRKSLTGAFAISSDYFDYSGILGVSPPVTLILANWWVDFKNSEGFLKYAPYSVGGVCRDIWCADSKDPTRC